MYSTYTCADLRMLYPRVKIKQRRTAGQVVLTLFASPGQSPKMNLYFKTINSNKYCLNGTELSTGSVQRIKKIGSNIKDITLGFCTKSSSH